MVSNLAAMKMLYISLKYHQLWIDCILCPTAEQQRREEAEAKRMETEREMKRKEEQAHEREAQLIREQEGNQTSNSAGI